MLNRIVLAVVVAVAVGLVLVGLLGPFLLQVHTPSTDVLGHFCKDYGWPVGILLGLWYFFAGGGLNLPSLRPPAK